ncbi:MAG: tetratricopeptide repeat protein [Deltaproteobacteria bacterium]|nr:tetratricopeptide repeat protein [Deltaproteobacteria bacterium]MDZ4225013.1 tetratricopeptide repeat protein [bacterium]
MSLILDALKKAEKDRQKNGGGLPSISPIIPDKKISRTRMILWVAGLVAALGVFAYLRFFKKEGVSLIPRPIAAVQKPSQSQDPESLKTEALTLYRENRFEESLLLWEKLALLLPAEAEIYNNQGLTLKKLGKREEARKTYQKALALKQNYPEALNNMGVLLLSEGNRAEAKLHFQKAVESDKNYADPYFNLALIYEQEGNVKMALMAYDQFLAASPEIDEALRQKIRQKKIRLEQE